MPVIRRRDVHGVQVSFLLQQFPVIVVRGAALIGSFLSRRVVCFHQPLRRLAPYAYPVRVDFFPGEKIINSPDPIPDEIPGGGNSDHEALVSEIAVFCCRTTN
jgi:hypothetical protein